MTSVGVRSGRLLVTGVGTHNQKDMRSGRLPAGESERTMIKVSQDNEASGLELFLGLDAARFSFADMALFW
jgi:hypothetical protein